MRLNFRQGIVSHQSSSGVQDFLSVNPSGNIDLQANNRPVTVTVAHHNSNYTFIEDFTVVDAWRGPFTNGVNYWLYWDFSLLTFERSFGYTLLEPVAQDAEPGNGNTEIVDVQPGTAPGVGAFTVNGYFQLAAGFNFAVIGSSDNDGNYSVVSSVYNDTLNQTVVSVNETVNAFVGPDYGSATFDIDFYGEPLLQEGRHWYNTATNRHYVWIGSAWTEVLRVFAAQFRAPNLFTPQSINIGDFTGTQIGDTSSILSGRVIFDEASNVIRRDDRTFFTTEDQFFANASRADGIRLESNVNRAQLLDAAAAAFSVVAVVNDGQVRSATYDDIGSTVVGILTENLLINEVGAMVVQGVVTNPAWNWTTGPSAVPVGRELWIDNGELVPYDPHTQLNRDSTTIVGILNGSVGQYFEVVGAYNLPKGDVVAVKDNTLNNDGNYTVEDTVYNSGPNTTTIYVAEIIIDPIASGNMLLKVGNFPQGRVPVARVYDNNTVIFEQGLGGVGDTGPAGSIENIPGATTSDLGAVFLNLDPVDPEIPIVVGDNDPRLSDARPPLAHTHAALDITVTPAFTIASLNAQGAFEELSVEKVEKSGDTLTGFLTLHAAPTAQLHAANKGYVDGLVSGLVWIEPVDYIDLVADDLTSAPGSPEDSDMYIVNNPGGVGTAFPNGWGGLTAGDLVRWNEVGAIWELVDHISNFAAGTRFGATILSGATASGTFSDQFIYELTSPGAAGVYTATWIPGPEMPPQLNQAFFVKNADSFHAFNQFVYDGTKWIKFGGASALVPDGVTLTQVGNTLSVKQFADGGVNDVQYWQGLEPADLASVYAPLGHNHPASAITFNTFVSPVPGLGGVAATDTQAAIEETYNEKAALQPNYATVGALPDPTTYAGMVAYVVADGAHYLAQSGAWARMAVYPLDIPYDISYFVAGNMLFADAVVGSLLATRQIDLAAGLPGALARAKVAPLAPVTYLIRVDDGATETVVGQLDFAAASTVGVFTFASPLTLVAGHALEIVNPSVVEPNILDIAITIIGCAKATYCG